MPTPTIQTLVTDAQQVLNLDSISAVRSVVAVALANANTGTPLNPNLTTQQLWNEFYQVVTKPKSDIESIIANQLMKFLYAPPAPGGVGADKQVIFNDGGVLAGDADFQWDKTLNRLAIVGSQTITGDLTVDTSTLKVDSTNNRVGVVTASPAYPLDVNGNGRFVNNIYVPSSVTYKVGPVGATWAGLRFDSANAMFLDSDTSITFRVNGGTSFLTAASIDSSGNVGIGVTPKTWQSTQRSLQIGIGGALFGRTASQDQVNLAANYYVDTSNNDIYIGNGYATLYKQNLGQHIFYNAASGLAGGTITFTQAMTLDASGNLLVGSALPVSGGKISGNSSTGPGGRFFSSAGDNQFAAMFDKSSATNTTSQWFIGFTINNQATGSGQINANGASQAAFGTFSDSRLKDNIVSLTSQLAKIVSLRPVEFDYKDGSGHQIGFVAQEMQEVYSDAVGEQNGFLTITGWSKTEARLVSAIKELAAKVQALEAKLA